MARPTIKEVQKASSVASELLKGNVEDKPTSGNKDKQISAKVNKNMYEKFTMINQAQGLSNNSALNMIIIKYVRENEDILKK